MSEENASEPSPSSPVPLIHIVLVRARFGERVRAFDEIIVSVRETIERLGGKPTISWRGEFSPSRRNLVFGPNLLADSGTRAPPSSILYDLEQMSRESPWASDRVLSFYRGHEVWSHDEASASYLSCRLDSRIRVVPIPISASWKTYRPSSAPSIDVAFVGSLSPRRTRLLQDLRRRGLSVFFSERCYANKRDLAYRDAKIVLNVHHRDRGAIFEQARCFYPMVNGSFVLSEANLPLSTEEKRVEKSIVFSPYERLVEEALFWSSDAQKESRLSRAEEGEKLLRSAPTSTVFQQILSRP